MSFISRNEYSKCFRACSEDNINAGLCSCINALKQGYDSQDKEVFRGEKIIMKEVFTHTKVPLEVIEISAITDFLRKLPLEWLKELVNYEYIDPDDKELWEEFQYDPDRLSELRDLDFKRQKRIRMQLTINKKIEHGKHRNRGGIGEAD